MQTSNLKIASQNIKWKNPIIWLWITVIIYIILQFFTLGTRGFDGDEGVILNVVQSNGWNQFWTRIAADVHPPLYHLLAKLSASIFGVHEWSVRLPAAAAGGALIFLGFWLGKIIWQGDKWRALVLGIFLGFAPYLFFFHQEARFYSLLLVGAVLTFGAFIDLIKKQNVRSWIIFALGALILIWTQYIGWFILGAELVSIIIIKRWKMLGGALIIFGLLVLSYVPYLKIALSQFTGRISETSSLMFGQNVIGLTGALYRFGADRLVLGVSPSELLAGGWYKIIIFLISLVIPLYIMVKGIDKNKKYHSWQVLAWTMVGLSVILALLVSEIGGRSTRYLLYLWPFYGALVVAGLWKISKIFTGKIIIIIFVATWLSALTNHIFYENKSTSVKDIAQYLGGVASASDAILVKGALAGGEEAVLKFYYKGKAEIVDYYANYSPGKLKETSETPEKQIIKLTDDHPVVWYYDFTYGTLNIGPEGIFVGSQNLGTDKEQKEVVIFRIEK